MLVVGDVHFDYPVRYLSGSHNIYFEAVKRSLRNVLSLARDGEIVVFTGDIFEKKDRIMNRVKNGLVEILEEGKKRGLDYWFIVGNHDLGAGGDISIGFLRLIGKVIDEPGVYGVEGKKVMFLPWMGGETKAKIEECDILVGHFRIDGAKVGNFLDRGDGCYSIEEFEKVSNLVVDGHYHDRVEVDRRVLVVGSIMSVRFGERNDKYVLRIDEDVEWISLPAVMEREVVYVDDVRKVGEELRGKVVRFDVEMGAVDMVEFGKRVEDVGPLWWEVNFVRRYAERGAGDVVKEVKGGMVEDVDRYVRERIMKEIPEGDREIFLRIWEDCK